MASYTATCDTIGSDPYPIPAHNISMVRDWAGTTRRLTYSKMAVFEVIQAHNLQNYNHATGRTPTLKESRSMTWQAIASGANGIFYYSYFDIQRNPDVAFAEEWRRLQEVAGEVVLFAPVLLSDAGEAPPVRIAGGAPQWFLSRARWHSVNSTDDDGRGTRELAPEGKNDYVLFAVSDGSGGGVVHFELDPTVGRAARVAVEASPFGPPPHDITPTDGGAGWTDDIPQMELRVYRVTLQG